MVYVHMGQRTHSGRRSGSRSRYSELYSQDKLQTEKGRPGEYQVFNYSSGRRSRTPTRPHYHDRAGDKPGRIRRIVDKRGKIQHPPHKARQRLSSFGRCYIHDEQQEGEEKMERFKEPCKTERTYQKLFKVQKKDR